MNDRFLCSLPRFCETAMQKAWHELKPGTKRKLTDGRECVILAPGIWNHGPGPDFAQAVLCIDGKERHGDVELHRKTSDWIQHGHAADPAYGNVILHVVNTDDSAPGNLLFLPDIPCLVLPEKQSADKTQMTFCASYFADAGEDSVRAFTEQAGLERMRLCADKLLYGMIHHGTWNTFFIRLMEILGLPDARTAFRELALRICAYPEEIRKSHFHTLLWGESGLIPDPVFAELEPEAEARVQSLWKEWWKIRMEASGTSGLKNRSRPLNSMERRIAAASLFSAENFQLLARHMPSILAECSLDPESFPAGMSFLFTPEEAFWKTHSSFTSELKSETALIGTEKQNILLTDVIIPAMHAYFRLTKQEEFLDVLERCYLALPGISSNRILRTMSEKCFPGRLRIFSTSASRQGLIYLYKTFCSPLSFQCAKCPLKNSLV